ncbi:hypothetical protein [Acidovorax sp. LjRoot117]|uniref:hypothetical protein n=1 Tax=Acidovorax sp. LjRoot117 TaxID=3342255 RepID=UPI003ECEE250
MSAVRQIGIKMTVDAQSVTTELPKVTREFANMGASAEQASARTTRSLAQVQMSVRDIVAGAAGLHVIGGGINAITKAITELPRNAFDFSKNLEVSQVGMAGILGSMTAINGKQTDYNQALRISSEYIRKLGDDALRTAATSSELTAVFQALLAPGLSARMTLEEIRQLTTVGTNAVKSMGLDAGQVVQELRDLVAGGITPASSTLATALGLKDSDIQQARASSEGLFKFLMDRLQGFEASSSAFGDTLKGRLDQVAEGATRVAAEGMEPLIKASKQALAEVSNLFVTIDQAGNVTLNQELVGTIREYATAAAQAMEISRDGLAVLWENRDAIMAVAAAWASVKLGNVVAETVAAMAAKAELAQASRLAAVQAAAEAAGNVEVVATSRQKIAAYLAELEAKAANARADVVAQAAQIATLNTTREAIVLSRAEVVAKLDSVRATMAQAEAQIAAARAAGAQSFALAALREGTQALTAAQARHAMLMTELAALGKQQASVNAALATATAAQTAAANAASAATGTLAAAQGAASIAGRALSGAIGFLGGPIGLVTTALTLGVTAWTLWGNSGSQAERKVAGEVSRSTSEIVSDLDKQIAKLNQRNALAAAGMGELARKGGEAAERLASLQAQIGNLQQGKGPDGGAALPEAARVDLLQKLLMQYGTLAGSVQRMEEAQGRLDKGGQNLTLTLTGQEQAWRKVNDGIKTVSAAQQEYESKLSASRQAWKTFKEGLEQTGASPEKIKALQTEQDQVEKSLAAERDKKIKELGASAASAHSHAIDAQIAAVQQSYKLLAAKTADALDEVQTLRQLDVISEFEAVQRKAALQQQDVENEQNSLKQKLVLLKSKKDTAKERETVEGQLAELEQKRINLQRAAARDMEMLLVKPQLEQVNAVRQGTQAIHDQAAAFEAQNRVYGQAGSALVDLTIAQLEKQRLDLEATDNVIPGYIEALERQIAAQKRLRAAMADKESKDWAKEQAENAVKANERATEAVERQNAQLAQSLTDNIMRGGKDAADYVEDLFRTMVLRPVIQAIMSPVSMVVNGVVNSAMSSMGLVSNGAGMFSGLTSGTGVLGTVGNWLGLGATAGTTTGIGVGTSLATPGMAAMVNPIAGTGAGIGGGMGALLSNPITLGLGAIAVLAAIGKATKGETRIGGQFGVAYDDRVVNNRRGETYTYVGQQYDRDFSNGERNALTNGSAYRLEGDPVENEQAIRDAVAGTAQTIDAMLKALGSTMRLEGFSAGLETSSKGRGGVFSGGRFVGGRTFGETGEGDNYEGTLYELFSTNSPDYKTAVENLTLDLKQSTVQALQEAAKAAAEAGEAFPRAIAQRLANVDAERLTSEAADALLLSINTTITGVAQFRASLDAMGLDKFADMAFDAAVALAEASGGFEKLQGNLASFYNNFYSPEERKANTERLVRERLDSVGIEMPKTREEYRRLTEDAIARADVEAANREQLIANVGKGAAGLNGSAISVADLGRLGLKDVDPALIDGKADPERQAQLGGFLDSLNDVLGSGMSADNVQASVAELVGLNAEVLGISTSASDTAAALLEMNEAFASLSDTAEDTAKKQKDAAKTATDAAYAAFQRSLNLALDAARAAMDVAQERVDAVRALRDTLRDPIDELGGLVQSTRSMAADQGNAIINQAVETMLRSGYLPESDDISAAISAARSTMGTGDYSNRLDYEAAQLILRNKLELLDEAAGEQLSVDELQLEEARAQVDHLEQLEKTAKEQLDATRGVDTSVKSVDEAFRAFMDSLKKESQGSQGTKPASGSGSISGPTFGPGDSGGGSAAQDARYKTPVYLGTAGVGYQAITDKDQIAHLDKLAPTFHKYDGTGDFVGLANDIKANGGTAKDIAALYGFYEKDVLAALDRYGLPHFEGGGSHLGGIRMVGENGPELEVTGASRIYSHGQLGAMLTGGNSADVVRAIEALREFLYNAIRASLVKQGDIETVLRKFDQMGIKERVAA